jgi:AraC-like DNA-binding protein
MKISTLLLYAIELYSCSCYERVFNRDFNVVLARTEDDLMKGIRRPDVHAVVLCFCSADESDVGALVRLNALTGSIPVLACTKTYNPNFVRLAAQSGENHFILCDMDAGRIQQSVLAAIRDEAGVREFLRLSCPSDVWSSPYISQMTDEIVYAFPHRLSTTELSRRLGISPRRIQVICKDTYEMSFSKLMRRIWVYHALTLMQRTSLDNIEIAMQLEYSDAGSLGRSLRKELGYGPSEARRQLAKEGRTPLELLFPP